MNWYKEKLFGLWNTVVSEADVEAPAPVERVAAVKGQIGENWVEEVLSSKFTAVRHKKNKAGDLKLTTEAPSKIVLIEVKNYEKSVPEEEIDKFYRDLAATSWDAGIFIELRPGGKGISYRYYQGFPCMFLTTEIGNSEVLLNAVELFCSFIRREKESGEESWRLMIEFANKLSELSQIKLRLGEFGSEMEKLGYQLQQFINGYKRLVSDVEDSIVGVDEDLDKILEDRACAPTLCKNLMSRIGKWKVLKTCLKSECGNYVLYFRKNADEFHWKCTDKKIIGEAIDMGAGYKDRMIVIDLDRATLKWFLSLVGAGGK
ncbi:hypothetical protein BNJ_00038 [Kaumoebavirus]|uniref:hypothetical protein n=1 Tax=Kaumoebavirus TaxID=1859492 RepID=UPI0009C1CF2D|nr:hypothetical protein BNJ_00038 [Kaumoebavirus]ARA71881.1 hypothetical protein BNJ_00038 [Kaumoebavirus]